MAPLRTCCTRCSRRLFKSGHGSFFGIINSILAGAFFSSGDAGSIRVKAGDLQMRRAIIITSTGGSGRGGDVRVEADHVLLDEAIIEAKAATVNSGDAGSITLEATDIELNGGAGIFAGSSGTGRAGQIFIKALDNLRLVNGSQISVATTQADAGDITLEVGDLLHLSNGSSITTSVAGGTGKGGNITLNSVFVVLDEGSRIIANAEGGQGGNILIRILGGGALFQSPDSRIEASSERGIEGSVVIDAPNTDIIAGFAGLPANFLDAATVLTQLCAGRSGANVSSLVVRKYEVLPDSPYALRVQLPRAIPTSGTAKQSRAPRTHYAGNPLPPMISCLGNS
jgi:large exoprotein involved in heme utilization and adhesion